MTFEEEFPSLKEYLHAELHTVHGQHIMDNCLDKQRVKEAIIKCTQDTDPLGKAINPYEILKELGLDE